MSFKSTDKPWIPPVKGEYSPPPQDIYKNVICRTINTSNYIDRHISHFIGKDGRKFIEWTNEFDVLYIFYKDRKIEVWGEDPTNVHNVIHFIIDKIKKMNQKRQERYEMKNNEEASRQEDTTESTTNNKEIRVEPVKPLEIDMSGPTPAETTSLMDV